MKLIKLAVLASFCFAAIVFCGSNLFSPKVIGESDKKFFGGILDVPTGVDASDNEYQDKVGIIWDTIRGANNYRIYRNTSDNSAGATEVGATAANYFFDSTAVVSQSYFYFVKAENGGTQSDFSSSDAGMRANGTPPGGPFVPLEPPLPPAGNPVTATKAYLGKTLFWDEQMSSTRTVSCGTCHRPASGGADPRTSAMDLTSTNPGPDGTFNTSDDIVGSRGVPANNLDGTYNLSANFGMNDQVTGRYAPSYLNAAYATDGLFWDGRASNEFRDQLTNAVVLATRGSLESQSAGPPLSDAEMAHAGRDWSQVATRMANSKPLALASKIPASLETWIDGRSYPELFEEAFGTPDVTPSRIALAIGTHERTLFSDRTPLDKFARGIGTLTPQEQMGRQTYIIADCDFCHNEALLSDQLFHNIGVRPQADDAGRFNETSNETDRGSFKTPTLRNVELRSRFMHNGGFGSLAEVVDFYSRGGDFTAPNINTSVIRNLALSPMEKDALVAFMSRPMTDPRVENETPPFDRPTLYTESEKVPIISGTGRAGTSGETPEVTAVEPPLVGNPSFTVGVSNALANSQAVLVIDSSDPGLGTTVPASGSFAREAVTTTDDGSGEGFASVSLAIPDSAALVGQTFFGRWYITDAAAVNGFSVSEVFEFTVFGEASNGNNVKFDFDGDSKSDVSIFRSGTNPGQWWWLRSSDGGNNAFSFGLASDTLVPADFTGDGKTDVAFFRESTGEWFILRSEDQSFFSFPFGTAGDIPAPGDFDGDGKADAAVYRPSTGTWFINRSSDGNTDIIGFGIAGDQPVVGDYDGDGKDDVAIYRPSNSQWWLNRSTDGVVVFQFGSGGDKTVQGDYTGDGKDDVAFWRPASGEWFVLRSEDQSFYSFPFGISTDIPAPGDYDGDGQQDAAVFRPSTTTWYLNGSTSGTQIVGFGATTDIPLANSFVRE